MKKVIKILIIVVILCIFSLPVSAKEPDEYIKEFDGVISQIGGGTSSKELFDSVGTEAFLYEILAPLSGGVGRIASLILLLLCGLVLMSVASLVEGKLGDAGCVGVSVIVSLAVMSVAVPPLREASEGILRISEFFSLFIPVASGILVSGGAMNTAMASAAGMNVTVSLISGIITPFFTSLSAFALAVGTIASFGDEPLLKLSGSIKSFFMWAMGVVSATLVGAMSLQSFIAVTRDSVSMRAARYAAQSLIPIVGGSVSAAMSTLATGLSYVKSIVGVGALATVTSIFLSPLIMLLLYRFALSFAAAVAGYLGVTRAERLYSAQRVSFDIYIAVYAVSVVIYIFEVALFMMCEVGAV